ncbi:MAG: tRNA pseudouridine synthase B [candidate division TA06 bacterium ADurb.Bin131]|uniref:tRNA pseudouridine synthase B n=1 Tax=candidate division TA06 bacterium ADurb.Bin131 TaxID=1852827 RepID=A0A1V6C4E6_UNCT6|nr:MAG: tRNA pseudouridine synthase B [candidate division TA06 bacterium ADurb.Bin131]HON05018.1 tRNA pseudouridine(55) synthase TruB [bacterium]HPC29615.1 tRNA pseudouridine(55) synthase TruB [bacterium]HRV03643.1 tRNA pseudouridine(55) synthase TruB [Candidatus Ratteibacteria bacterium]
MIDINELNGFLNVNKPSGMTSYDVIRHIKRISNFKGKIGHTGTLDPLASGVLVICIGSATKKAGKFLAMEKEYLATMLLGTTTDTDDIQGKIIETKKIDDTTLDIDLINKTIHSFIGEIQQVPPSVSALTRQGVRLYKLHRQGRPVIPEARKVFIYEIDVKKVEIPRVVFKVVCSRGTYIRALCRDIGRKLGYGAVQEALIRTRVGFFSIEQSITLDQLKKDGIKKYLMNTNII